MDQKVSQSLASCSRHLLILLAGGRSSRFSSSTEPLKTLTVVLGKPLFIYSLEAFCSLKVDLDIILVVPSSHKDKFVELIGTYGYPGVTVLEGGASRFESAANAIQAVSRDDYQSVLVHDACRPVFTSCYLQRIEKILKSALSCGFVPCTPVTSSLKKVTKGLVTESVSRESLFTVQTPQIFPYQEYRTRVSQVIKNYESGYETITDDAHFMKPLLDQVRCFEGEPMNIKVTYVEDLKRVQCYLTLLSEES